VSGNTDDPSVVVSDVSDNAKVPLVYKRNRQVSGSGAPFQTAPVEKYLNTLRVYLNSRRVYGGFFMEKMKRKIVGIIPARYASSRLPGKPLVDIHGKPMLWWVWSAVKQVTGLDEVYIATDDERIRVAAEEFRANVLMTTRECSCMIDRIWQASNTIEADYYVAVNGDEPLLEPEVIKQILPKTSSDTAWVSGLCREFTNPVEVIDPANIKIVVGDNGNALYHSRSPIPYPHKTTRFAYKKYVGVECFNKLALDFYVSHTQTVLERIEDLGAIRFLEHGIPIHYTLVESQSLSVDTERDLEVVRVRLAPPPSIFRYRSGRWLTPFTHPSGVLKRLAPSCLTERHVDVHQAYLETSRSASSCRLDWRAA
jgi:3-deoxy-manno-octulosonate cytidylyltransferase (CMP-KDO synthetase)